MDGIGDPRFLFSFYVPRPTRTGRRHGEANSAVDGVLNHGIQWILNFKSASGATRTIATVPSPRLLDERRSEGIPKVPSFNATPDSPSTALAMIFSHRSACVPSQPLFRRRTGLLYATLVLYTVTCETTTLDQQRHTGRRPRPDQDLISTPACNRDELLWGLHPTTAAPGGSALV